MRWRGRRESVNVENRRSVRGGVGLAGGGLGTILIIGLMLYMSGGDPQVLLDSGILDQASQGPVVDGPASPQETEQTEFVSVVLADTEDVWNALFQQEGRSYVEPKLVLFRGMVQSACGRASASVGPFYCPADQDVYLDLQFFDELHQRFGAAGDFAQAYVIAHEVGHHVQKLVGMSDEVHSEQQRLDQTDANRLSVRLELQADYLAGVWAHHIQKTKQVLETGDIEEALNAANAIGDDRLQKQAQGTIVPDSFTHGTSAQRIRWFKRGFETGDFDGANQLFELAYEQL
ncbi:MAG: neutral zinc metallopeptidase [Candidatus Hydrogenedentes bacterium]|nr:neutral zinc metallopeptidase [Candidatus Hydrogenedentota bacterium]